MATETAWTSIKAYEEILPELSRLRKLVLESLIQYTSQHGVAPTATELGVYMEDSGVGNRGMTAHKRLPEIADQWNAIHRGAARKCRSTGKTAYTWHLGPPLGQSLTSHRGLRRYYVRFYVLWKNHTWSDAAIHVWSKPGRRALEKAVWEGHPVAYPGTDMALAEAHHIVERREDPLPE